MTVLLPDLDESDDTVDDAMTLDRASLLAGLRARIRRIEGVGGADGRAVVPLGVPDLDASLPGGGLALGAVHELTGPDARLDGGAATAVAALVLARLAEGRGPCFWVARDRGTSAPAPYAPGLASYGLAPGRLVLVRVDRSGHQGDQDVLWALEEALRCAPVGAVLGEVGALTLSASRRLQLAAEAGGVPGILLRLGAPQREEASAAVTRWRINALPSEGTGLPTWRVELLRARGGQPGAWHLSWRDGRLIGGPVQGSAIAESLGLARGDGGHAGLQSCPTLAQSGQALDTAGELIAAQRIVKLRIAGG